MEAAAEVPTWLESTSAFVSAGVLSGHSGGFLPPVSSELASVIVQVRMAIGPAAEEVQIHGGGKAALRAFKNISCREKREFQRKITFENREH